MRIFGERLSFRADKQAWFDHADVLYIFKESMGGDGRTKRFVAKLEWTEYQEGDSITSIDPTIIQRRTQRDDGEAPVLDMLAEELMRAGVKIDVLREKADELRATQAHLEDMRALVFKTGKP